MACIRNIGNDTEIDRILKRDFVSPVKTGYVEIGEDNFCMPIYYREYEEKIQNFQVRDDDVFVTGHPKSGTTWLQETIWLVVNNLDYTATTNINITNRFPQLELPALRSNLFSMPGVYSDLFKYLDESKSPRCIKTHLHWSLLPEHIRNGTKQPKIITALRSPEDVCVSLYHHSRMWDGYKGTFENFCELFLAGRLTFGPFWKTVLSYWEQRELSNVLFIKYQEMKDDFPAVIRKIAKFLENPLSEDQVETLANYLSFDSMKRNPLYNMDPTIKETLTEIGACVVESSFIRSGKVGGYKSRMSTGLIERFEAWTKENLLGLELSME